MKVTSYSQVLKASAVSGGAQFVELLIRTLRTKIVAVLIGPAGVGLVSLYQSLIDTVGTVAGLGVDASAVRRIAESGASGDAARVRAVQRAVVTATTGTGLIGALACVVLAGPLGGWALGSQADMWVVVCLAVPVFFETLTKGRLAWLRGTRQITAVAKCQVVTALVGTLAAAAIYAQWGTSGIVPVLCISSAVGLSVAWAYTRESLPSVLHGTWTELMPEIRDLIRLGVALMWGTVVLVGSTLAVRWIIVRELSLRDAGLYQAAWSLSGLLSGFILSAMALDYYPRLTAAARDNVQLNRLVSEQLEIAILLAVPCLLGTLALGPALIVLFFSHSFAAAAHMLPWFVLGVYLQIVSWPVGYIQLGKGAGVWFAATQTCFAAVHVTAVYLCIQRFDLVGAGIAFCASYVVYLGVVLIVGRRLSGYRWSADVVGLLLIATVAMCAGVSLATTGPGRWPLVIGLSLTVVSACYSVIRLFRTLGPDHPIAVAVGMRGLVRPTRL